MYFCDPDIFQAFSLTGEHKLVYERTGACVGYRYSMEGEVNNSSLFLGDCDNQAGYFDLVDGSYLTLRPHQSELRPLSLTMSPLSDYSDLCLNTTVGLRVFNEVRRPARLMLSLTEETFFQEDRKLLKNAVIPPNNADCDFKACGFNKPITPIKTLPSSQVETCSNPWECVTVVVKTARRPHLVIRLAQSIRDSYGFDLPIVCVDDGPDDHPQDMLDQIAKYPLLRYVVSEDPDLGIAEGRNQALKLVQTKYFFILDDDVLFMKTTDLKTMISVLDTTDAVVVGVRLAGRANFAGLMKFGYYNSPVRRLGYFPATCFKLNWTVPNFPQCVSCELNSNVWMARTQHILDLGGWDPELKIREHKDVFIRMKAAGYKVATCNHILLEHLKPKAGSEEQVEGYNEKRHRGREGQRFQRLTNGRYNIQDVFGYHDADVDEVGEPVFNKGPPRPPSECFH